MGISNSLDRQNVEDGFTEPAENNGKIERIREMLTHNPRDLLLFELLIQSEAPLDQILKLKIKNIFALTVGDALPFPEGAPNQNGTIVVTETILQGIERYLKETKLTEEDHVFKSRKGSRPLTPTSVSHLVKKWCEAAQIDGSPGIRSLRKMSQGLHQSRAGADLELFKEVRYEDTLKPVQKETLREIVFNELLQAIISGKIRPGKKIFARRIAETMNVSLMPVRDALGRLEAGGFISWTHKRAFVVNELSRKDLNEIFQIRMALESLAADPIYRNRSEEMIENLENYRERHVSAGTIKDFEELTRLNVEFHKMLFQNVDMRIVKQILDNLLARVSPYYYTVLVYDSESFDYGQPARGHDKIIASLRGGNLTEFREALKEDNMNGNTFIDRTLESIEKASDKS